MLKHLRSFKIPHNTVVFDYVATILLSIMLSYLTKIPLVIWTVITMIVGEGFHYLMNIPSKYSNLFYFLKNTDWSIDRLGL